MQKILEEDLPRVLASLILSYLKEKEVHVTTWGTEGTKQGEFAYPRGVTSLSSGEIVVADTHNHRIQVFTLDGKFLRMWGKQGTKPGAFSCPSDTSALPSLSGSSDEIFVVDMCNHRIQVFTSERTFLRMWGKQGKNQGEFACPFNITLLSSGPSYEVAITDTFNNRVQVFTPEGQFLRMWGEEGEKEGEFDYPSGICALPSGEVIVVDKDNHRIQVFSPEGKFLRMWGKGGKGEGEFHYPRGVSVFPSDEVVVADTYNHRIQVFTPAGKFLRMWGTEQGRRGIKAGEFDCPYNIVSLPSGEVIIADANNHRIQVFRTLLD